MDRAPKKARVDGQVLMEGSTGDATTSFSPDDRTMALFESTGITGVSVVRSRVERARSALMATFPYKCVQEYRFASARSLLHPEYSTLLARHRARLGTIPNSDIATTPTTAMCRKVLDLGCCMGTDLRQFVLDGWCTAGDGVGLDSQQPFIDAGHDMFGDHDSALSFATADALAGVDAIPTAGRGPFAVIYCGAFFHLLDELDQIRLAELAYMLLDPGGTLFGRHVCSAELKPFDVHPENDVVSQLRYLHTPVSFKAMLEHHGFVDVSVQGHAVDIGKQSLEHQAERGRKLYLAFSARRPHVGPM